MAVELIEENGQTTSLCEETTPLQVFSNVQRTSTTTALSTTSAELTTTNVTSTAMTTNATIVTGNMATAHSVELDVEKGADLFNLSSIPPVSSSSLLPPLATTVDPSNGSVNSTNSALPLGVNIGQSVTSSATATSESAVMSIAESLTNSGLANMGIFSPSNSLISDCTTTSSLPATEISNVAFVDSFQQCAEKISLNDDVDTMVQTSADISKPDPIVEQ